MRGSRRCQRGLQLGNDVREVAVKVFTIGEVEASRQLAEDLLPHANRVGERPDHNLTVYPPLLFQLLQMNKQVLDNK
ncbi:hypothetical protein D3C84_1255530 [compost metagenome]